MPPPGPGSPQAYCRPVSQTLFWVGLLLVEPSISGSVGEGVGLGGATEAEDTGAADADAASDAAPADDAAVAVAVAVAVDIAEVASSCIAPEDPAAVDEHPATPAVTRASPTTRAFNRPFIPYPYSVVIGMMLTPISYLRRSLPPNGSTE